MPEKKEKRKKKQNETSTAAVDSRHLKVEVVE